MTYNTKFGRIVQLDVFDLKGGLILRQDISDTALTVDLGPYASGIYSFVFTTADGQQVQKKLIKQ